MQLFPVVFYVLIAEHKFYFRFVINVKELCHAVAKTRVFFCVPRSSSPVLRAAKFVGHNILFSHGHQHIF